MKSQTLERDSEPDWKPLETVFAPRQCAAFMHMGSVGTIQLYKHRKTRQYLNIDAETGAFFRYDGKGYRSVTREEALSRVLDRPRPPYQS